MQGKVVVCVSKEMKDLDLNLIAPSSISLPTFSSAHEESKSFEHLFSK